MSTPVRRALVSVSDKTHLDRLARVLVDAKVEVLSTGGTYKALRELGVSALQVSDYTGFPEILDGRVKTLHPRIHAGLLARATKEHEAELAHHDIAPIDLVVVNLYPFQETVRRKSCSLEDAIENIDVGGPTMLRAAAKNWSRVAVIVDPEDYAVLEQALREGEGAVSDVLRRRWATKAFAHTAEYDGAIASYLSAKLERDCDAATTSEPSPLDVPQRLFVHGTGRNPLRYGENPHQPAAFFTNDELGGMNSAHQHQGKELSYNNLLDADAALGLIRDLAPLGPAAVVIKHATPCGAAVGGPTSALSDVYMRAREADAESAFGGIVALSGTVDEAVARRLTETFLEVVIAPSYSVAALEHLTTKKNLRVLEIPRMFDSTDVPPLRVRSICGGYLVQRDDRLGVGAERSRIATAREPTPGELLGLDLAWRVAKHVRSNAVVLSQGGVTIGIGGGQTSRVEAARQAVARAGAKARGAVLASDGFFPFRDSVDEAAKLGVTAIIQPGGSMRDQEVIDAANEHDIAMLITGERHFRH